MTFYPPIPEQQVPHCDFTGQVAPALTEKAAFVVSEKSDRFTHGGARNGAGRPSTPIDLKRVKALRAQKFSTREIAERFGVPHHVVKYALLKEKYGE